ncbi:hypothetical protein Skr01_50910 [Sphaerisporangium krabiense]|uniref:Putative oxidoreductase n=1 Tax=Sphaerisporangium krabiense TaxID=763782 RepID=A0A7W8Z9N6_9ACTN|nr:DoxX family protein [Sphaerisporangium krabiense]MBB5630059.1 putative oxidoreductase [Sphaerisporangium krabiense]GII65006.1 hypothetical protein Skr01_50910 [Sphaerisporangium krabiense]
MRRAFQDLAALAARLGVGGIFFANGWHKLEFGLTATSDQFGKMGAPGPGVWAAATMLIELLGGALLVAGLAVPVCGLILFAEALAVFVLVSGDTGLPLTGGDVNLIVALGSASVLLAVVGAGRVSVDHLVVIRRREAEAADDMAADAEADDVISSWRDAARPSGPASDHEVTRVDTPRDEDATPKPPPTGPVTFAKMKDPAADPSGSAKSSPSGSPGSSGTSSDSGTSGSSRSSAPSGSSGSPDGSDTGDVTAPRKAPRARRAAKPAESRSADTESPRDAPPPAGRDRLVAGGRTPSDTD